MIYPGFLFHRSLAWPHSELFAGLPGSEVLGLAALRMVVVEESRPLNALSRDFTLFRAATGVDHQGSSASSCLNMDIPPRSHLSAKLMRLPRQVPPA